MKAPTEIVGRKITQVDLRTAFGFAHTLWFELHDRWDPGSASGLKGANTIIAWAKNPDAALPRSRSPRPLYAMLNRLAYGELKKYVRKDRDGLLAEEDYDDAGLHSP